MVLGGVMRDSVTKADLQEVQLKLDAVLAAATTKGSEGSGEGRKIPIGDLRISLVGAIAALLALGTPAGLVVSNHYRIQEHLENTRIHADEKKAFSFGGVAYAGEVEQKIRAQAEADANKERQTYHVLRELHCSAELGANTRAFCASTYPDSPVPFNQPK